MIKFEDLIDGLVSDGSKKGMNEVQSASAKQKAMQHLQMAKEIASGAGLDLVSLAEECMDAKEGAMEGASFDEEEPESKRMMAYDEEESDEEESEDDEEEKPVMKNAKAHAMILMLKKQKKA